MDLLISKHEKYFKLCLNSLPAKAQSEDANRIAIVYFCIQGLDLLGKLNLSEMEEIQYSKSIYSNLIKDPLNEIQSFRPSPTFRLLDGEEEEDSISYDLPNLAATLFALSILLALGSDYLKVIDRHKVMKFVSKLQIKEGSEAGGFKPVLGADGIAFGESDLRHCYTALCVRKLLHYDMLPEEKRNHDIDIKLVESYIINRVNFNGGLSSNRYTESHSGLTFCGLASLKLLGYDFSNNNNWVDNTVRWLVYRQVDFPDSIKAYKELNQNEDDSYEYWDLDDIGGFNGRENKFGDTCYSWWCSASLKLLGEEYLELINFTAAEEHLLTMTQSKLMGGFGKDKDSFPDPFHTFLGISALCLWKMAKPEGHGYAGENELRDIDELLVISARLRNFLEKSIKWED